MRNDHDITNKEKGKHYDDDDEGDIVGRLPVAGQDAALDAILTTGTVYYLSFNTGDPGTTGANEWAGGRQAITFVDAASGTKASGGSDASQEFDDIPAESGGLGYFSIWSASTSGTFMCGGTMSGLSGSLPEDATITVASGAITFTNA